MVQDSKNNLSIISELKAHQITNWRQERLYDAFELSPYYIDAGKMKILAAVKDAIKRQEYFCKWTGDIHKNPEYDGIYLYNTALKLIAFGCSGGEQFPLGKYDSARRLRPYKQKKIVFSDLYRNEFDRSVDLDIYAPVFETNLNDTKVIGLLALKINPYKFLFPLLQSSPGLNTTLETYMVKVRDNEVQYLNELKYLKNSALTFMTTVLKRRIPGSPGHWRPEKFRRRPRLPRDCGICFDLDYCRHKLDTGNKNRQG